MEKTEACFERMLLIRDVNCGIITKEQIQQLFALFDLNEKQKERVLLLMKMKQVNPIPEDKVPQRVRDFRNPSVIKTWHKEIDVETIRELQRKHFEETLEVYRKAVKDKPELVEKYEEEIPIFAEALVNLDGKIYSTVNKKIVRACMKVSSYRVREKRKFGWVCGTHMSRVREEFERWVRRVFSQEELTELIECLSGEKELTSKQTDAVKVLLHNTPKTSVIRYSSSIFDD